MHSSSAEGVVDKFSSKEDTINKSLEKNKYQLRETLFGVSSMILNFKNYVFILDPKSYYLTPNH